MTSTARLPVAFLGHGSPMNTLQRNSFTDAWRQFGAVVGKPRAVLMISAHWYTRGTYVTAMAAPETIHDFRGFPPALSEFQYRAPGSPELALQVSKLLQPLPVGLDQEWGLDHGTWSVLAHVFPDADVPVVQLSLDGTQPPQFHYELGQRLAPLRDDGVLILGSGNVVHNLGLLRMQGAAYDWALRFNDLARSHLGERDHPSLIHYQRLGEDARLAIPSDEHYLPLLYIAGLQQAHEQPRFLCDGIVAGSISMLSVAFGA